VEFEQAIMPLRGTTIAIAPSKQFTKGLYLSARIITTLSNTDRPTQILRCLTIGPISKNNFLPTTFRHNKLPDIPVG
jgi:hypothetical protein